MTIGGLVLAAGAGRRFGGPKALARLDGRPLVEIVHERLVAAGCDPVVTVLGAEADEVWSGADLGEVVVNAAWQEGLASSLEAGLDALDGRAEVVVIVLADQPRIGTSAVERLVDAWRDGAQAAVATYGGKPRNPVLLAASVWEQVLAEAHGDVGARAWLRNHPDQVVEVPCDDTGSPVDVDTPGDLENLRDV